MLYFIAKMKSLQMCIIKIQTIIIISQMIGIIQKNEPYNLA